MDKDVKKALITVFVVVAICTTGLLIWAKPWRVAEIKKEESGRYD